jgi:hypothetical protein
MHTAKIYFDRLERYILTSRDAKIKSKGFPILASREVNITFQRLLWNDQN